MDNFDELALEWDNEPRRINRAKVVAEYIQKHVQIKVGMIGFEYGCGTGLLSFALRDRFARIVLGDSSQGMLQVLEKKIIAGNIRNMYPQKMDLLTDEVIETQYDVIYTLMTLHHLVDYETVLNKFFRLLRPEGYLCVIDLDQEDGSFHGEGFIGHNGFDRRELAESFERQGFFLVKEEKCFEQVREKSDGSKTIYPLFIMTGQKKQVACI